jgi:methylated-DNA-[protein]-cysteine S-methyltransferase
MPLVYTLADSPIGPLLLAGDGQGLHRLAFVRGKRPVRPDAAWAPDTRGRLGGVAEQLQAYFAGELRAFTVPLAPRGTPFQLQVWDELERIPYGETVSYGELARRIRKPDAVRAVGAANGANPIAIIVPCHRVIGADGSLTGFGGGLPVKKALLALERGERSLL